MADVDVVLPDEEGEELPDPEPGDAVDEDAPWVAPPCVATELDPFELVSPEAPVELELHATEATTSPPKKETERRSVIARTVPPSRGLVNAHPTFRAAVYRGVIQMD